jgi:type 4 prepilin peptidase 1 (EC:3.4.23.43). Aspartic peptidase. MEROPS family A24A
VLIALTAIDLDTQLLPDNLTLPLLWVGLLANVQGLFARLPDAVIGAAAGYLVLWSVYWLFKLLTGREGMGYGDFKLLAALGAWFGWQALPALLLISSVVGAVIGVSLMLIRRAQGGTAIAFGPYLALAGLLMLFLPRTAYNLMPF